MIKTLKPKIEGWKPLDFAIIANSIGLNFIKFAPIGLTIFALAFIYELFIAKTVKLNFANEGYKKNIFLFWIPFLLALIGLIFTANFKQAFEDIGRLLPYFIFPIFLLAYSKDRKAQLNNWVLFGFIFGLMIRFSIDFYESISGYLQDNNIQVFFYSYLDTDTNILAIITMFGVLYLLDYLLSTRLKSLENKLFIHGLILFLSLCILLLQSRIVILFFFSGLFLVLFWNWKQKRKWSVLLTIVFSGFIMLIPAFQGRFQVISSESSFTKPKDSTLKNIVQIENSPCMTSTQLRLNSIKASWKLIQKNPIFGVGTGDWRDELVREYEASDMPCNAHEKTAPHNQYLRIFLKNGLIGLLIYLVYLVYLFNLYRSQKRFGQLPFLVTLIFCGVGYDLLDVGSAAPVFAFFSSWLFFDENK